MSAALRCLLCGVVFAPFGGTVRTAASNLAAHGCADAIGRDESLRPSVLQLHPSRTSIKRPGGVA